MSNRPVIHADGAGGLPPEKLEILRELGEAFGGDREAISIYLAKFGWSKVVAPNIRLVKRELADKAAQAEKAGTFAGRLARAKPSGAAAMSAQAAPVATGNADADAGEGKERSPYYEVEVVCPFCSTHFPASAMRSKSLVISYSYRNSDYPLMVPEATQAMPGYHLEDPLQRAVVVCPKCLYASSSLANFITDSAVAGTRGILARFPERKLRRIATALEASSETRRLVCAPLAAAAGEDPSLPGMVFQKPRRTPDELIAAFRLAAISESILGEFDVFQHYKAGEAMLAAAKVAWSEKRIEEENGFLVEALKHVDRCYQMGSATALPIYILGVLHWHLGNPTQARHWIGQILIDRGKLGNASKFRRFAEALNEEIKRKNEESKRA